MKHGRGAFRNEARPPLSAMLLAAAGLLPPVLALLVRLAAGAQPDTPLPGMLGGLALSYAALIFSFLGGIWWGVASARADREILPRLLGLAVAPPLLALLLVALSVGWPVACATLMGIAIAATPLADRLLERQGLVPAWWMGLRVPFSLALGALTIGLGFALA